MAGSASHLTRLWPDAIKMGFLCLNIISICLLCDYLQVFPFRRGKSVANLLPNQIGPLCVSFCHLRASMGISLGCRLKLVNFESSSPMAHLKSKFVPISLDVARCIGKTFISNAISCFHWIQDAASSSHRPPLLFPHHEKFPFRQPTLIL